MEREKVQWIFLSIQITQIRSIFLYPVQIILFYLSPRKGHDLRIIVLWFPKIDFISTLADQSCGIIIFQQMHTSSLVLQTLQAMGMTYQTTLNK